MRSKRSKKTNLEKLVNKLFTKGEKEVKELVARQTKEGMPILFTCVSCYVIGYMAGKTK